MIADTVSNAVRWSRKNLFNRWYNTVLSFAVVGILYLVLRGFIAWAFAMAEWSVIPANLELLLIGTYPREEAWRIWAVIWLVVLLTGISAGLWKGVMHVIAVGVTIAGLVLALVPFGVIAGVTRAAFVAAALVCIGGNLLGRLESARPVVSRALPIAWVLSFPIAMTMLRGFSESGFMPEVLTTQWGGLLLTLILAAVGITLSFPIGVLLALGRRSKLPAIRIVSTAYIELVRGVPLVTILFMAQVMVPVFLPEVRIDKIFRAMIGLTAFSAAYMAENVRGGLQGVAPGQYDAANAIGLKPGRMMFLVILPQALRSVIPAIVGQFISLFKDTSLVAIIGLLDLLGIARSIINNPDWLGLQGEVYLFVALTYFVFAFSMSRVSRRVETALGLGLDG